MHPQRAMHSRETNVRGPPARPPARGRPRLLARLSQRRAAQEPPHGRRVGFPRPAFYVSRPEAEAQLASALGEDTRSRTVVVCGLGGTVRD
jgi:hypothetical protein